MCPLLKMQCPTEEATASHLRMIAIASIVGKATCGVPGDQAGILALGCLENFDHNRVGSPKKSLNNEMRAINLQNVAHLPQCYSLIFKEGRSIQECED